MHTNIFIHTTFDIIFHFIDLSNIMDSEYLSNIINSEYLSK